MSEDDYNEFDGEFGNADTEPPPSEPNTEAPETEKSRNNGDADLAADMYESLVARGEADDGVDIDWKRKGELRKMARDATDDEYAAILKEAKELLKDAPGYFENFKWNCDNDRLDAKTEGVGEEEPED